MFGFHRGVMTVERQAAWSNRTTLIAVAIAVALTAGGALAIHAAAGGPAGEASGHSGVPPGFGPGFGGPGEPARTVHAESVISDAHGSFRTELTQTGDISATSGASITVRSDDGFSHTYLLGPDTRQPRRALQTGQHVTVRATVIDGTALATAVLPAR